jgi:hypothetical protein
VWWQQRYTHAVVLAVAERLIVWDVLDGILQVAVADILVLHAEGGAGGPARSR